MIIKVFVHNTKLQVSQINLTVNTTNNSAQRRTKHIKKFEPEKNFGGQIQMLCFSRADQPENYGSQDATYGGTLLKFANAIATVTHATPQQTKTIALCDWNCIKMVKIKKVILNPNMWAILEFIGRWGKSTMLEPIMFVLSF